MNSYPQLEAAWDGPLSMVRHAELTDDSCGQILEALADVPTPKSDECLDRRLVTLLWMMSPTVERGAAVMRQKGTIDKHLIARLTNGVEEELFRILGIP